VRVRPIPHPRSPRGLRIVYNDGVVSTIKNSSLPCLELDTSK
jgi:hypothetical protein